MLSKSVIKCYHRSFTVCSCNQKKLWDRCPTFSLIAYIQLRGGGVGGGVGGIPGGVVSVLVGLHDATAVVAATLSSQVSGYCIWPRHGPRNASRECMTDLVSQWMALGLC